MCNREAYQVYEQIQHMVGAVSALQNIGACMRSLGQLDSAFFYLDKALNIAEQKHLITQLAYLYSSLGNLYEEQGNYRKALTYNQESLKYPIMRSGNFIKSCKCRTPPCFMLKSRL